MANYVLNESKMFSDISDGIAIVINSETGIYYGMNNFGTNVFENILNGASTEAILETLKGLPNVPAEFDANYTAFIEAMIKYELVIEGGDGSGEVKIDAEVAKNNEFVLDLREYNDAQELLLADPIHEVKEDTGWTPEKDSLNPDEEDVQRREGKVQ